MAASTSSVNFENISELQTASATKESEMKKALDAYSSDSSTANLLNVQMRSQEWTVMQSVMSALYKELGDALKGICQKIG